VSILNPLFDAVAWVIMRIHAGLAVPFGASSGWAWGLSIVILVMLMRALMVPLFIKQVNAQRKMQSHMPQLQEIRKRYKNDKQRLNEETMKFYKENGINPLGGCLPLVAQLPVFYSLFYVLRAIAEWQPGQTPKYGLTEPVVESARQAHIFGATLADKFLFPIAGETWPSRIVILCFVAVSATTTFLTMRQSSRRGMMQQGAMDPDNPMANTQKYMMYIAPFFALTGLYWQFGLVIYWVTTNVWTLGQQHILFRNLPVVGSATVGASAVQSVPGTTSVTGKSSAAVTGKSSAATKAVTSGRPSSAKTSSANGKTSSANTKASSANSNAEPPVKPAASKEFVPNASTRKAAPKAGTNGSAAAAAAGAVTSSAPSSAPGGGARGLLRFGKKPEPEAVPAAPQTKMVRQQPVKQTRSKRSGKR
jgi:YidC/Oxa1 family membrane protein insertase